MYYKLQHGNKYIQDATISAQQQIQTLCIGQNKLQTKLEYKRRDGFNTPGQKQEIEIPTQNKLTNHKIMINFLTNYFFFQQLQSYYKHYCQNTAFQKFNNYFSTQRPYPLNSIMNDQIFFLKSNNLITCTSQNLVNSVLFNDFRGNNTQSLGFLLHIKCFQQNLIIIFRQFEKSKEKKNQKEKKRFKLFFSIFQGKRKVTTWQQTNQIF
eukprot:TRINITY_DN8825_c0_g1_i4.p3 TRINITY_DN8825_c0_g1~~TRINITY_DN8825_c0_g1_i4.p3  ORF type:complete len:209 (+),score=-1.21 TRINITY_DN8825_c0_g1_i4:548-1174(+)